MGLAGERSRVGKELLLFGVAGYGQIQQAKQAVESLLAKKLLLYRSSTDSVSVWHGTDIDLRGRADQAKSRLSSTFEIVPFLSKEVPLPTWKPIEYNDQYSIERSFQSRYVTAREALATKEASREGLGQASSFDGVIFFVVPENEAELAELRNDRSRRLQTTQQSSLRYRSVLSSCSNYRWKCMRCNLFSRIRCCSLRIPWWSQSCST